MIKKSRRGDAIIVVLCIMAILVTLCLSILLAASVLINNAQAKGAAEQCRLSAVTLSKELEKDLFSANPTSPFYAYIQGALQPDNPLTSWPYFNTDEPGHGENDGVYKTLTLRDTQQTQTGHLSLRLYWEWSGDSQIKDDICLRVDVTAEKLGQQHTTHMLFRLKVSAEEGGKWYWTLDERS